jgi:glutamine cyclotransferase
MKKQYLATILIAITVLSAVSITYFLSNTKPSNSTILQYTYEIVNVYPHDENAFTQGLAFNDDGVLYESTGFYGNSTLRKTDLETGRTLEIHYLPNQFFGEGITIFGDRIIQLTWTSHTAFIYDKQSLNVLEEFSYSTEGWGLTDNGDKLIMSDGTSNLYFLNPQTFEKIGQVEVQDDSGPVTSLNELEYINGDIYANVWKEEKIAIINIQTGQVKAWIDLSGLYDTAGSDPEDVLNGIAYDAGGKRLFVTGKRWPNLYQINLIPLQ